MTKPFPFVLRAISCAVLGSLMSQQAYSKSFEYSPKVQIQIGADDNVHRLADEESIGDLTSSSSRSDITLEAGAGVDLEYYDNRQTLQIDANLFRRDYIEFDALDFTGADINANWTWKSSTRWDAEAGYNFRRDQSNFSEQNLAQGDLFNQNKVYFGLTGHIDETKDVYFKTSLRSRDYELRDQLENERYDFSLGLRKTTVLGNSIAFELNRAEGNYPNRLNFSQFNESLQSYSENQATIKLRWKPGQKSSVRADIGYVDRKHNGELSAFDFNGLVYDFRLKWDIGYRSELTAQYSKKIRDTENTNTVFNEEERLKTTFKWNFSNKLWLTSAVTLLDADFVQNQDDREDFATILEAGIVYDIDKKSTFGLTIKSRDRSSNNQLSEFDSNIALFSYQRRL